MKINYRGIVYRVVLCVSIPIYLTMHVAAILPACVYWFVTGKNLYECLPVGESLWHRFDQWQMAGGK